MSTDVTTSGTGREATLSDLVADEIAAELGRQRMSQRQLAGKLGVSAPWVSDRLAGKTSISLDDLAVIAAGLRRPITHFLPGSVAEVGPEPEARSQPMRTRPTHARRRGSLPTVTYTRLAERPPDGRPNGRPGTGVTPPTVRRPVRIGTGTPPKT